MEDFIPNINFFPDYINERTIKPNQFIIDSCISLFSISFDSDEKMISHDSFLVKSLLKTSKEFKGMNLLSILFDFYNLLKLQNTDTVFYLRKLFAYAFYADQFPRDQYYNVINDISFIFEQLASEENMEPELVEYSAASISYSLACISNACKNIKLYSNEDTKKYYSLTMIALSFYENEKTWSFAGARPYFVEFFMNVLHCFPFDNDESIQKELDVLLQKILRLIIPSFNYFKSSSHEFPKLLTHLVSFLESSYSIANQIDVLTFITDIIGRFPQFSNFLFNYHNFEMISGFLVFVISQANIQIEQEECNKSINLNLDPNKQYTNDEILHSETFMNQVSPEYQLPNFDPSIASDLPQDLPSFSQCSYFPALLDVVFQLCQLNEKAQHPQFIKKVLHLTYKSTSFSIETFLLMWGRNYIVFEPQNSISNLTKIGYFDRILDICFEKLRAKEYLDFIINLYYYIIKNLPIDNLFIGSLFSRYEIAIIELRNDAVLTNFLMTFCLIAPKNVSVHLTPLFYDQRLSHILLYLQSCHIASSQYEETIQESVTQIRLNFLHYVAILLSQQSYKEILYKSIMFINSLLKMILEPGTNQYSIFYISEAACQLKSRDRSLPAIFNFFQTAFKDSETNESIRNVSDQALQIVSTAFESNTEEIASIFLHTSFFPHLVKYVSSLQSPERMFLMLNIARRCTLVKGAVADYFYEMDLFSKIQPLVVSIYGDAVPTEFIRHIWSIVFADENFSKNQEQFILNSNAFDDSSFDPELKLMEYLEKHDQIINAAPLTLIYNLVKPNRDRFISFLTYIQKICDNDLKSALEVNNSNFPSILLSSIEDYHEMIEKDEVFDMILALFTSLAGHALKSRDALAFFHNFSTLKGNFRPFFTLDLLRTLLFLFQSPDDSPYAFYNLDSVNGMIQLPNVQIPLISQFTFFIEFELTQKPELYGILFSIESKGYQCTLSLRNSQIFFEIGSRNNMAKGHFNYVFPPNIWTHIAVTYLGGNFAFYVHGKEQANLQIPRFFLPQGQVKSCVGRNISCNIGSFGFLKVALNSILIKLLSLFPKTAVTSFTPAEMSDFTFESAPLFSGELYSNSIYLYNAAISPTKDNSANLAYMPVIPEKMNIIGNIYGFSPRAKDMLRSIGGASVFLPIFAQLDQPLMPKPGESISYELDPIFLPFLIQVLIAYLKDSPSNQEDFATINGFMVISYLLFRSKLQNITANVIEMMKRLYKEIIVPRLAYQMLEYIFLDIRLWIYLPPDLQITVYQIIYDLIEKSDNDRKRWAVFSLPFNKLLYIMRTFFWSEYTDDSICLYNSPKKNKVTQQIEGQRPTSDIKTIRSLFWKIAQSIYAMSFNEISASTICYLSFDQSDLDFSVETLTFFLYILRKRNPIMVQTLISQNYTFEKFFSLLASKSEEVRCQCIHIFILFHYLDQQQSESLFRPYCKQEWIALIMATMNTLYLTAIFSDVIYGYFYGFFDVEKNQVMPKVRVSTLQQPITLGYTFADLDLFPLAMMAIADLPDEYCSKYLMVNDRSIAIQLATFVGHPNWDLPFLMFLIHRMPNESSPFDKSSYICIHTLCSLYHLTIQQGTITNMPQYILKSNSRIGQDFTHITRRIYTYYFDTFLIKQGMNQDSTQNTGFSPKIQPSVLYSIFLQVFEFLFLIDSTSRFYLPTFAQPNSDLNTVIISDEDQQVRRVTFQELHRNQLNAAVPNIRICYATRTLDNGAWVDSELAQRLLFAFSLYPDVYSLPYKPAQLHPFFINSFVLGVGLQHQFPAFEKYITKSLEFIPNDPKCMNENQYQSFLNYFSGLAKVYINTDIQHPSHFYMMRDSNEYRNIISYRLKSKSQMGDSIPVFDATFHQHPYNFAHIILEKYSAIEVSMMKYSQKVQKETNKLFSQQSSAIEKVSSHLAKMNPTDSLIHLHLRNDQAQLQLHQFAASIKTKQTECMKVYRNLWRSLSSVGGPWCPIGHNNNHDHWKLEQIQPLSMKRGRFVTNYNFKDHKDASLLRDTGKLEETQNLYNEHLKQVRLSEFSEKSSVITIGVDEEEIKATKKDDDLAFSYALDNIILKADANRITMKKVFKGSLLLTKTFLIFNCTERSKKSVRIPLMSITHVFIRRYLLMDTAFEVFTSTQHSYMFDFASGQRNHILLELKKFDLPNLVFLQTCEEDAYPLLEEIRHQWQIGELSNFEYLLKLNLLSGRTYNDLSQYPVFPWVLSDYSSEVLNLDDPKSYRDLSSPIGALNEERLRMLQERMDIPNEEYQYLYGSFYSSSAVVIGYLIRIEPFTSLHIDLQEGRFDNPARLFNSIPKAWNSVVASTMDFRELIPEFYYLPDFLVNSNHFDLGTGKGDVELPRWASSPRDFITKNRAALESKYASAMLPRWIDLIFGVLSRGEESKSANNVFSPYFFETALTPEVLADPKKLKLIQEYAVCFGNAPRQIFFEPHKSKKMHLMRPPITTFGHRFALIIDTKSTILSLEAIVSPAHSQKQESKQLQYQNSIQVVNSRFESLHYVYGVNSSPKVQLLINSGVTENDIPILTNTIQTMNGFAVTAVPWDTSIMISALSTGIPMHIKRIHTKKITAIAISPHYYASASLDCTVILWRMAPSSPQIPMSIMSKHKSYISCIALNEEVDLCVSVSQNGDIITQSLLTGNFIKKITVTSHSNSENAGLVSAASVKEAASKLRQSLAEQSNTIDSILALPDSQNTEQLNESIESQEIDLTKTESQNDQLNTIELHKDQLSSIKSQDLNVPDASTLFTPVSSSSDFISTFNQSSQSIISLNKNSTTNLTASSAAIASQSNVNSVGDPTSILIFNSGMICLNFSQADRSIVYIFDQNLEEINHVELEGLLQCWTAIEWPDENDYVFAAIKSGGLAIYKLPTFEIAWNQPQVNFVVSRLAVINYPLQIVIGTYCGKVLTLPLQQ